MKRQQTGLRPVERKYENNADISPVYKLGVLKILIPLLIIGSFFKRQYKLGQY